ncbi:MAG: PLP-dependent aminotransferase family protein, partial [Pseudomonadota bacterium]
GTMFPGLRLGYLVLPEALAPAFVTGMEELYRSGQAPVQATLAEFIAQGHFNAHVRRMRLLYGGRLELLQHAIASHFEPAEVAVSGGDTGLHLALRLPAGSDDQAVARDALALGVAVRPLSRYYYHAGRAAPGLVLGYACVADEQIAPAFALLARAIRNNRRE